MKQRLLAALLTFLSAQPALAQTAPAAAPLPADELALVNVIERSLPGVVYVTTSYPGNPGQIFSSGGQGPQGSGSGFFVTAQGHVLTNFHVVDGASSISVRLQDDDRHYDARVVGTAPDYDLALLQVQGTPATRIKPLPLGNSANLRVGQRVIALGAPFGLEFSASDGIVSAVGRSVPMGTRGVPQAAIQTDAAINPGNSGGPLLNSAGQVIGINTQIISPAGAVTGVGQNAGVGFAIPVDTVRRLLSRLQSGATVTGPTLGVQVLPLPLTALTEDARRDFGLPTEGALVMTVQPNGPAARAGLRGGSQTVNTQIGRLVFGGDVITAVDSRKVTTPDDLLEYLFSRQAGDQVKLTVRRGAQSMSLTATLAEGTAQGR